MMDFLTNPAILYWIIGLAIGVVSLIYLSAELRRTPEPVLEQDRDASADSRLPANS